MSVRCYAPGHSTASGTGSRRSCFTLAQLLLLRSVCHSAREQEAGHDRFGSDCLLTPDDLRTPPISGVSRQVVTRCRSLVWVMQQCSQHVTF